MKNIIEIKIKEGVLISYYPNPVDIDIDIAKHIIRERIAIQTTKYIDLIIHIKNIKHISYEAKEYLNNHGIKDLRRSAFVIENKFQQTIFDLFLKPEIEVVVNSFTTEEKAMKWLKSFEN